MTNASRRRGTLVVVLSATAALVAAQSLAVFASTAPGLGTATSFAVLAGTTITNTGNSVVNGDMGVSPGTAIVGFKPGGAGTDNGTQHTGTDALAIQAKNDLTTAYNVAASSPCNFNKTGQNLGGQTLTPGTYCQTTAPTLTGTVTLKGNGVYIFQAGSTMVTAPNATVSLIDGAQPCNVFWQVSSSATLDTGTTFVGTIMAYADIALNDGASISGRALARTGQVTMINNAISIPTSCNAVSVAGPSPTPTTAGSSTPTPRASATPQLPGAGAPPTGKGTNGWMAAGLLGLLAALGLATPVLVRRRR